MVIQASSGLQGIVKDMRVSDHLQKCRVGHRAAVCLNEQSHLFM